MVSDRLIQECIAHDKAEYGKAKSYDETYIELVDLQDRGCLIENINKCAMCPKFKLSCPIR